MGRGAGWSARRGSGLGAILVGFIPGGDEGKCAPRTLALERMALSTSMDGDFDTGNVRYKARERYSFG